MGEFTGLEVIVGSTTYQPEIYDRESHLFEPGAVWRAVVESCDKALWSSVVIKENGTTVLTGYLLKRIDERGRCHISGMDTFVKVKSAWITEQDIETEIGQTVAYWIDFIMNYTDLEYIYPISAHDQYVEPHVSLSPLSLYDALQLVVRFAGLYIWVSSNGKVNFGHIIDEVRGTLPSGYLSREKREHDEIARHQVSVFGMGGIVGIAEGDMLGDPVKRIAVIESPFIGSVSDAELTAENALAVWNKHDDVRTVELPGVYADYQLTDIVTENG